MIPESGQFTKEIKLVEAHRLDSAPPIQLIVRQDTSMVVKASIRSQRHSSPSRGRMITFERLLDLKSTPAMNQGHPVPVPHAADDHHRTAHRNFTWGRHMGHPE
jgi:hypothetical protein